MKAKSIYCFTLLIIALISGIPQARAQYDPQFTQYMFNEIFINPAYAGSREAASLTSLYRRQWTGITGAPMTITFSGHAPLMQNKMGVGFSIMHEEIGVTRRQMVYGSYAYRFKLGKGKFSFGLMGGLHSLTENLQQINTTDATQVDPRFASNIQGQMMPNFGAGMYYYTKRFYAGVSIPRMINNNFIATTSVLNLENKIDVNRFHYYLTSGCLFDINDNLKLKPQIMVMAVHNSPLVVELNANALLRETLWLGASYRSGSDISAIVGYQFSRQFLVGYSYDYSINQLRDFNSGSHEIVLNYLFSYRRNKIETPRYFN
jgi:type IX secretion system PorP/SprF family membrane protein